MRTYASRPAPNRSSGFFPPGPAKLRSFGIQAKLIVGAPGDVYEREAEQVAERVMRMPDACACGGKCDHCRAKEEEEKVRTLRLPGVQQGPETAPASVQEALRSPGQALDPASATFFSSRFGHDFRNVRVHTGSEAARSTKEIQASAFTVGRDIVFAPGQYAPGSDSGRRLLAHELTHVLQQGSAGGIGDVVQRDVKKPTKAEEVADLKVDKSKNGDPCACVVVPHNDEQKARRIGELLHQFCSYNVALVDPTITDREIPIPGTHKEKRKKTGGGEEEVDVQNTVDPNELFPKNVAEECMNDEKTCEANMKGKAKATKRSEVEAFLQRKYFLAVKDCSASFTLPVVALHNNRMDDTQAYLEKLQKGKAKPADFKVDVDKKSTGGTTVDDLKKKLKDLGAEETPKDPKKPKDVSDLLIGKSGLTNIFRWCVSDDLSKCHIGDPENPDDVVWVTNEKDFETLSKKDINVALQSEIPTSKTSRSLTDLSTLFLFLRQIFGDRLDKLILQLEQDRDTDIQELADMIDELQKLAEFKDLTLGDALIGLLKALLKLIEILLDFLVLLLAQAAKAGLTTPHFVNIETGGLKKSMTPVDDFLFVSKVLKELGLFCCGADDAAKATAEKSIQDEMKKLEPAAK